MPEEKRQGLDDKISDANDRLRGYIGRTRKKFAQLEATIDRLKSGGSDVFDRIRTRLELPEDASEEAVHASIGALQARCAELRSTVKRLRGKNVEAVRKMASLEDKIEQLQKKVDASDGSRALAAIQLRQSKIDKASLTAHVEGLVTQRNDVSEDATALIKGIDALENGADPDSLTGWAGQ